MRRCGIAQPVDCCLAGNDPLRSVNAFRAQTGRTAPREHLRRDGDHARVRERRVRVRVRRASRASPTFASLPSLLSPRAWRRWPLAASAAAAHASCRLLRFGFEPDCLARDPASGACRFDVDTPDYGPQIAVWLESADGTTFVDTLVVTNGVALYGIGNRPGRWDFRSGPLFPYGRRIMALPVWAHRRGVLYESVQMNDGKDNWMTFHEPVSSPESHFCRPMMKTEIVDAVTCASGTFRDAKGLLQPGEARTYYPPRGDILDWSTVCIPIISSGGSACDFGDAPQYGLINDLDVIAAATPAYDRGFSATWTIPAGLADGDYALMVEVGKEFDENAAFTHHVVHRARGGEQLRRLRPERQRRPAVGGLPRAVSFRRRARRSRRRRRPRRTDTATGPASPATCIRSTRRSARRRRAAASSACAPATARAAPAWSTSTRSPARRSTARPRPRPRRRASTSPSCRNRRRRRRSRSASRRTAARR